MPLQYSEAPADRCAPVHWGYLRFHGSRVVSPNSHQNSLASVYQETMHYLKAPLCFFSSTLAHSPVSHSLLSLTLSLCASLIHINPCTACPFISHPGQVPVASHAQSPGCTPDRPPALRKDSLTPRLRTLAGTPPSEPAPESSHMGSKAAARRLCWRPSCRIIIIWFPAFSASTELLVATAATRCSTISPINSQDL